MRIFGQKGGKGQLFSVLLKQEKDRSLSANIYIARLFSIGFGFHFVCNSLVGPQKPVCKSHLSYTRKVKADIINVCKAPWAGAGGGHPPQGQDWPMAGLGTHL